MNKTRAYKTDWQRKWRELNPEKHFLQKLAWGVARRAKVLKKAKLKTVKKEVPEENRPGYCRKCGIFLHGAEAKFCGTC